MEDVVAPYFRDAILFWDENRGNKPETRQKEAENV
jgi:hypothetical protein